MPGTKGMTHYSLETKLQAVRLHEEQGLRYAQVAEQLGIRKTERIEKWCRDYRREGELAFHRPIGRPRKAASDEETLERLKMENALLKKFHTELRTLILAKRDIGLSNTTEENTL
jgi:transposase